MKEGGAPLTGAHQAKVTTLRRLIARNLLVTSVPSR